MGLRQQNRRHEAVSSGARWHGNHTPSGASHIRLTLGRGRCRAHRTPDHARNGCDQGGEHRAGGLAMQARREVGSRTVPTEVASAV